MKREHVFSFTGRLNEHKLKALNPIEVWSGTATQRCSYSAETYFFLWPTISPDIVRRSTRVRFFYCSGEQCLAAHRRAVAFIGCLHEAGRTTGEALELDAVVA